MLFSYYHHNIEDYILIRNASYHMFLSHVIILILSLNLIEHIKIIYKFSQYKENQKKKKREQV